MHVVIISDLDVQLIMLLLDDVRLEVYFLTKKKKKRKSILSLYVELFEYYNGLLWKVQCIILTILWRPFFLNWILIRCGNWNWVVKLSRNVCVYLLWNN